MAVAVQNWDSNQVPLTAARSAESILAVLHHQRIALETLCSRGRPVPGLRPPGIPLSPAQRERLVTLAIRLLTIAATSAETECYRILSVAEAEASKIVRDAQTDVDTLKQWLDPSMARHDRSSVEEEVAASSCQPPTPPVPLRHLDVADRAALAQEDPGEPGDEFFASFADDNVDRWGFMDDDLVGVGPALVRRLLRRPGVVNEPRRA